MTEPVRVAAVGIGWWSGLLADAIPKGTNLRLVTCTTRSPEKRAAFAEKYRCRQAESYDAVLGCFLRKAKFPPAPLVLAMTLGRILERSFVQSLQVSAADLSIFIEKPISATLLFITAFVMLTPAVRWRWSRSGVAAKPA